MLLSAAIIPPEAARAELASMTSLIGLIAPQVGTLPVVEPRMRITGFGNLTTPDTRRLLEVLEQLVNSWGPLPTVRFARPDVTVRGEIVVGMAGDVEGLVSFARSVPLQVQRLGLYVDRRMFWPGLALGEVPEGVALHGVSESLRELADWEGGEWTVPGISLLRGVVRPQGSSLEEFALVPA